MARALGRACLDDLAEQHEESDQAGLFVIARRERGQQGEGNQLVGVQPAHFQILDGRPHDRVAEQKRARHRAEIRHRAGAENPFNHEAVEHEQQADNGLRQLNLRVRMIMPTVAA